MSNTIDLAKSYSTGKLEVHDSWLVTSSAGVADDAPSDGSIFPASGGEFSSPGLPPAGSFDESSFEGSSVET